jgi:peptidoglycan/LPS O-acetylase OafA/YrhL
MLLMGAPQRWFSGDFLPLWFHRSVQWLSKVSYSVFLIHYAVILGVSAWVSAYWPEDVWANAWGMLVSAVLSIGLGSALHRLTELQSHDWKRLVAWSLVFMASVGLAMQWS